MTTATVTRIGVREATRGFSGLINQANLFGKTFIIERQGTPVARIIPEPKKVPKYTIKDLLALRFKGNDKNASKKIKKIVYGV